MMNGPGGASAVSLKNCLRDKSQVLEQYKRVECHYCQKIFKDPVQLKCGHLICRKCAEKIMDQPNNRKVAQCPYEKCSVKITGEQSFSASIDQQEKVKHFLLSDMKCEVSEDCLWNGLFKTYEKHIEEKHTFIVREVPNINSTYQLSKSDGTASSKNVQIVGSLTSIDSGISCKSNNSINPPALTDFPAMSDSLKNEVQCEYIENKNLSQESTELVVERLSCPQKLESLNCKDSLLMKESATDSQQYLPSNVHKKSSTLLSRETTIHKVPTRRGSLSPIKLRKPQSHSRNLSLPAISVTTQITTSYAQNPIVENVPVKTDNIQKQIKLRRRASVPVSLQLISSKTPSCNRQKRPGSAMLTTDHTGGMFSLPQRRTLAPFENTASQFTNRQDTCISTSRCLNVDCQQIIATKDKIIATKDKIIRQKDLEIQRLQMRTLGLD